MRKCPVCRDHTPVRVARFRRFWQRKWLGILGIRPYRCRSCRCRFWWFVTGRRRSAHTSGEDGISQSSGFLISRDSIRFDEVIEEIRKAERKSATRTTSGQVRQFPTGVRTRRRLRKEERS